jgi:hypothetical protein
MKKIFTLLVAALLVTGATYACGDGKKCDKDKKCCKKECSKDKDSKEKDAKTKTKGKTTTVKA